MKTKRTKFYPSLLMTILALFINSCTDEVENNASKENELSNNLLIKNFNSDELEVYQTFKNTIFSFKGGFVSVDVCVPDKPQEPLEPSEENEGVEVNF